MERLQQFNGVYELAYGDSYSDFLINSGMPRELAMQNHVCWPQTLEIHICDKNVTISAPKETVRYAATMVLDEAAQHVIQPSVNTEISWTVLIEMVECLATMEDDKLKITSKDFQMNSVAYSAEYEECKLFELYKNAVLIVNITRPQIGTSANVYYHKITKAKKKICTVL